MSEPDRPASTSRQKRTWTCGRCRGGTMAPGTTPSSIERWTRRGPPDPSAGRRLRCSASSISVRHRHDRGPRRAPAAHPGRLDMSRTGLAWVVNGYVLMAGAAARSAAGLPTCSAGGGSSSPARSSSLSPRYLRGRHEPQMLIYSRFLQGVGEACRKPAALGSSIAPLLGPADRVRRSASGATVRPGRHAGPVVGGLIVATPAGAGSSMSRSGCGDRLALVGRLVRETGWSAPGRSSTSPAC